MTIKIFQCVRCVHYKGDLRCTAFVEQIPKEIIINRNDHTQPYPGDNGIQFEPIEKDTA